MDPLPQWALPTSLAPRIQTPHHSGRRRVPVTMAVMHWTASPPDPSRPWGADPARLRRWARGQGARSSTHIIIDRAGAVLQTCALDLTAWHVGAENARSIGVDLECVGWLRWVDGRLVNAYGAPHCGPAYRGHEPYTASQVASLCYVVHRLARVIPALQRPDAWVGHVDLTRSGKTDPGPLMPWDLLREAIRPGYDITTVTDWEALGLGVVTRDPYREAP